MFLFSYVPLSYLGEVLGSDLPDVHGEDDEVEVPLDVVHDFVLEIHLPLVRGDVEGHLVLNDGLANVLDTCRKRGQRSMSMVKWLNGQ